MSHRPERAPQVRLGPVHPPEAVATAAQVGVAAPVEVGLREHGQVVRIRLGAAGDRREGVRLITASNRREGLRLVTASYRRQGVPLVTASYRREDPVQRLAQ